MSTQQKATKQALLAEIIKCGKDPVYFIDTYAKIQHPLKGLIPFKTYDFQKDIVQGYIKHRFNIILKSRQLGVTTITAAYVAWYTLFHRDKNVIIVATKRETAQTMIRMIKNIFNHIPRWMSDIARITTNNKQSVELSNGSRVKAVPLTPDVGRSEAISLLVVDEVAHIPNFEEFWAGLFPTLARGGSAALMSTPYGTANFFHKQFIRARDGIDDFNCRFGTYVNPKNPMEVYNDRFMWWVCPDYNDAWFTAQCAGKSPRDIAQEFLCFDGNTRIFTDKGFKKIKEIKVGDLVLTHKGRFRKVIDAKNREADTVFKIKTFNNFIESSITPEHPILHEKNGWIEVEKLNLKEKICHFPKKIEKENVVSSIKLIDIIKKTDFNLILEDDKIFINDRRFKTKINNVIQIDYDLGLLVGLFLAEGYKGKNYICYSFNRDTELTTWVVKICDILKNKFGFENPKIYNSSSKCSVLQISSQIISQFISTMINGNSCYNKRISNYAYEVGNKQFYNGILDGLFFGDGCLKYEYNKSFTTTSENLAYDVKYLLTYCNFGDFSVRKQRKNPQGEILGRKVSISDLYQVTLLRTANQICDKVSELKQKKGEKCYRYSNFIGENEGFNLTSLSQKNKVCESTIVYNIEVEEDNSFVTEHFVSHNCSFNASGDTFIDNETLSNLERVVLPPSEIFPANRDVWIWEQPRMNGFYLISCDVSRGDAADFSAFHVLRLDCNPIVQVAEYKGKIKPDHLGYLLYEVAKHYNNAIIAPENNSGWSVPTINKLQEVGYANVYYSRKRSTGYKRNQMVDPYYAQQRNDYLPGYSITTANRLEMLARMEKYIRERELIINSPRLLDEFKTFIVNMNNKPEAQRGMSDDLVMALAGGLWVRDEAFLYSYRSDSYAEALLNGMSISNRTTNQYGDFNFNGGGFYDRSRIKEHLVQQNKIVMGNGAVEDLSWLLPTKK